MERKLFSPQMNTVNLIYLLIYFHFTQSYEQQDISKCKLTHLGLSYQGTQSKTEGGALCQSWASRKPIHKIDETITDEKFLEKSKEKAKNYCRNPNRNELGPWCYTMDPELIDDTCDIPLCNYLECKLTGPGMEYGGQHHKAVSDKNCLKWDKHRNKVRNISGDIYEQEKFSKRRFPDETRGDASKYCRNPDGDIGGPWCFVNSKEGRGVVEKQYCDIPFCDVENCVTFTRDSNIYSHYTLINGTLDNLTFGLKLWHPDHEINEYSARLLLTLFALPLTGDEIEELHIGIEIFISHNESALTIGNKDKPEYEPIENVLKSSSFTYFSLMWNSGFVSLYLLGAKQPIFLAEYRWRKNLFGLHPNKFFYYSIQGKNMLWSFPFCDDDYECEVHKTTSLNYERFWPLRHANASHDLQFYIRAFHSAIVKFQFSATVDYPSIVLTLSRNKDNITNVVLNTDKNGIIELKSVTVVQLLNFWEWRQFVVTFFSDTMQVYWERDIGTQLIIEAKHDYISQIRWFSPATIDSLAEWTFFCSAPELSEPPKPWPPECVLNMDEINYEGSQSVTRKGHPCVPWIYDKTLQQSIDKNVVLKSWNYCRDPLSEKEGTYCYAISQSPKLKILKEKCLLRMCRSSECRMAGTGNDYIGPVNTTRSNRTCQFWTENSPHKVKSELLNGTLFPDQDPEKAENYCRDPSRNIAGPWCYTTDETVMWDLCNVRDCTYAEECIIMTRGSGEGRYIYILPEWKDSAFGTGLHFALKEWDPDKLDGIMFDIMPMEVGRGFIRLIIGADDNERIVVFYSDKDSTSAEVVKEKSMPHLIPAGKWTAFWLQMRKGEIFFGYEGSSEPLFTWEHDKKEDAFEPVFMTYMSIQNNVIGVHFKCTECHTERTSTKSVTRIMPINLWQETEMNTFQNLSIYARGNGILLIPFLQMPLSGEYYAAAIGDKGTYVMFIKNKVNRAATLQMVDLEKPVLDTVKWAHYFFQFDEKNIEIFRNNISVLKYTTRKTFLFYWFSVTVEEGWVEWAANCEPPDIDGDPIDGGWSNWSPFHCTVTCGGGTGIRYRSCTNPKPNIRGALCKGPHSNTGTCNEFDCGDLSPITLDKIRQQLKQKHYSFTVSENENIIIENDFELLELIRKESPKSSYQWTRNGIYLKEIPGQIEFENDNIKITSVQAKRDSGIYICMLHRIHGERVVIRVVTVAIIPETTEIIVRETLDIILECNAAILGYVYTDLAQAWLHNGKVVIDYGITTLAAVITEKLEYVWLNYSGNWSCRVTQPDLKFSWIIKIIKVHIKNRPSWITHLMEDQFTKPIFGKFNERNVVFVLIGIIVGIFGFVFSCLIVYLKCSSLPKRPYKKLNTK